VFLSQACGGDSALKGEVENLFWLRRSAQEIFLFSDA
jgi:hypothetical protein